MATTTTNYKGYQIEQETVNRVVIYKDSKYINSTTDLGSAQYMIDSGYLGNETELELRVLSLITTYKIQIKNLKQGLEKSSPLVRSAGNAQITLLKNVTGELERILKD
jgi:hypothetical protein